MIIHIKVVEDHKDYQWVGEDEKDEKENGTDDQYENLQGNLLKTCGVDDQKLILRKYRKAFFR